jgi:hypothetical protein
LRPSHFYSRRFTVAAKAHGLTDKTSLAPDYIPGAASPGKFFWTPPPVHPKKRAKIRVLPDYRAVRKTGRVRVFTQAPRDTAPHDDRLPRPISTAQNGGIVREKSCKSA